ncbi:MAG: hypothetical protein HY078_04825 [Elusimicrobia bacterium]|nr:hypothetical protein [Elusimicrobiota bacterium]
MIVVTAATPWESQPLVRRWSLASAGEGLFKGALDGRRLVVAQTGVGLVKTRQTLSRIETGEPVIAVSSGLCGALQPGIKPGDLAVDLRGAPIEAVEAARETARALGLGFHAGIFHTSARVESRPEAKRELGRSLRAVAVDMESAAVREWCASRGGLFLGARAVLDAVDDRLPDGAPEDASAGALARYALAHWSDLPLLLRLGARQRRAMRDLADFLDRWLRTLPVEEAAQRR